MNEKRIPTEDTRILALEYFIGEFLPMLIHRHPNQPALLKTLQQWAADPAPKNPGSALAVDQAARMLSKIP